METYLQTRTYLRENWLTRKTGHARAAELTLFLLGLLFLGSALYLFDFMGAALWMSANPHQVFTLHQYWRPFTTLFAHADLGHVLSNSVLFLPFSYFLSRHFGLLLYPLLGFVCATLTNVIVLATMPEYTSLVGVSGLVYWMGGAWLTLFFLIDRRDRTGIRLGKVLMVGGVLFVPDVLLPQVSHLAHYVGLLLGVLAGYLTYAWNRAKYEAAEVREEVTIAIPDWEAEWKKEQEEGAVTLALLPGVKTNQFAQVTPVEYKKTSD
jgi:rhomboid protease GluP